MPHGPLMGVYPAITAHPVGGFIAQQNGPAIVSQLYKPE